MASLSRKLLSNPAQMLGLGLGSGLDFMTAEGCDLLQLLKGDEGCEEGPSALTSCEYLRGTRNKHFPHEDTSRCRPARQQRGPDVKMACQVTPEATWEE